MLYLENRYSIQERAHKAYKENPSPQCERTRKSYRENPSPVRERVGRTYGKNPSPVKKRVLQKYHSNPSVFINQSRRAYHADVESSRSIKCQRYASNPLSAIKRPRIYYAQHRDQILQQSMHHQHTTIAAINVNIIKFLIGKQFLKHSVNLFKDSLGSWGIDTSQ